MVRYCRFCDDSQNGKACYCSWLIQMCMLVAIALFSSFLEIWVFCIQHKVGTIAMKYREVAALTLV